MLHTADGLACLFYPSSVITCLSLGESSMFWTGGKPAVPVGSQCCSTEAHRCTLFLLIAPALPLLGPDHKSLQFIFTVHCTQTHSHIIRRSFLTLTQKHVHSPVVSAHVCSVSVYKYGPETAVMAPASNKQRAEKPPIPASL